MANLVRNFIKGRMNKSVDERLVPDGEYIDALNIRMGSTEASEIGAVENTKGNTPLTALSYNGTLLSDQARCIGAYQDGANETMYWFVHDSGFPLGAAGKLDLIVSYKADTDVLTYHVISIYDDTTASSTTLNFDPSYLITGVDLVQDLLFFTDDKNPPRRINVTKNYPDPIANVDDALLGEDILVIKAPPITSPSIAPFNNNTQDNFMEERLICFAYRYRYEDGEYSATSQFSAPSYTSNFWDFDLDSYLNSGMVNTTNACEVTYNTGGALVVGIDILFKEMDDNIIRVIEKINKEEAGLPDNAPQTLTFDNSRIFTILPESEILRLYDNVPRFAKAQTVMDNRLVYGNYVDGYNLIDYLGAPTRMEYETSLVSLQVGAEELTTLRQASIYNIDPTSPSYIVTNSALLIDFSPVASNLLSGATISFNIRLSHADYTTDGGTIAEPTTQTANGSVLAYPTSETVSALLDFSYTLPQAYPDFASLFASADFINAIGSPIAPIADACDSSEVFTNVFNCAIPSQQSGGNPTPVDQTNSGIDAVGEPIRSTNPTLNILSLQFPATRYSANSGADRVYEYYRIDSSSVVYSALGTPKSLHSNRGYEVGMVYMDEYNRSSTALVSPTNSIHVPCSNSIFSNRIRVTIPPPQRAPSWATRYKFVIKPDEENYETIYSFFLVNDPANNATWFLLEGENAAKVEDGDRYIVKSDTSGATTSCVYTTVLDKVPQEKNFLGEPSETIPACPSGTYMKLKANNFSVSQTTNPAITPGWQKQIVTRDTGQIGGEENPYPILPYIFPEVTEPSIPAGSRIRFQIEQTRLGGAGQECEQRTFYYDKTYQSSSDYDDIVDWFYGEPEVQSDLNGSTGNAEVEDACDVSNAVMPVTSSEGDVQIVYDENGYSFLQFTYGITASECTNFYRWYKNGNDIRFIASGTAACPSLFDATTPGRRSTVKVRWEIYRATDTLVFETMPQDSLPDLWYESSESYPIDAVGNHGGNVTDQDIALGTSGVVDTAFFNCIAYGNGVESYKIRDSVFGKPITLGNRVTTVSAQDFKEADRFADLTYSGVFNNESNVNKLNEFNLGLLNFKPLEESFGPIEKLFANQTNILVLQEDKISYVLAGKNLLSDSTQGGVIASVPEVLGTQMSRTEEFGISNNPESFARWGADTYFTDAKRGAVLLLRGAGTPSDSLGVASDSGMRSWFRDMFIANFATQKLGGYDPYMDEYVLSNNDRPLPSVPVCLACGVTQTFTLTSAGESYCVNLGSTVGFASVVYEVIDAAATATAVISAEYNSFDFDSGSIGEGDSGSFAIDKNIVNIENTDINIVYSGTGKLIVQVTVECPDADEITIKLVTVTKNQDAGDTIHNEYRWTDGTFVSPLHSSAVKFISGTNIPLVSQFTEISGLQGGGIIPSDVATVTIISNRQGGDTYQLTATDRFLYLISSTNYDEVDVAALLTAAEAYTVPVGGLVPVGGPSVYTAEFNMSALSNGDYLYLIWNYATVVATPLCYDASNKAGACCGCVCDPSNCQSFEVNNTNSGQATFSYTECGTATTEFLSIGGGQVATVCSDTYPVITANDAANVNITITDCDCGDGYTPPVFEGLLDTYPGAAAGYSVRRLASATTTLMRVRRDTGGATGDSDEADVTYNASDVLGLDSLLSNADAGVLSTTLGEFVGLGTNPDGLASPADGYVVTWFDQSGNANDATQAASTTQPQIITAGAIEVQNGKPSANFSSGSVVMDLTTSFFIKSYAYVGKPIGRSQIFGPDSSSVRTINGTSGYRNYTFEWAAQNVTALHNGTDISSTNNLIAVTLSNDVVLFETSRSSGISATQIGKENQQFISEAIAYPTAKSSSFSAMSADINTFYSIYP